MKRQIKPKPNRNKAVILDLCNRLQQSQPGLDRSRAEHDLAEILGVPQDALVRTILKRTSTTIQTHQLNAERDDYVYQINMRYEDRTKPPINGHYYPPMYVIKSWNSLNDGVMLSYLEICKQARRFI